MSLKTSESNVFTDPNSPSGYKKVGIVFGVVVLVGLEGLWGVGLRARVRIRAEVEVEVLGLEL